MVVVVGSGSMLLKRPRRMVPTSSSTLCPLAVLSYGSSSTAALSRTRSFRTARSRRTIWLVILGQYPGGSIEALQSGQSELISPKNSSMHPVW